MNLLSKYLAVLSLGFLALGCSGAGSTGSSNSGFATQPLGNFQSQQQLSPTDTSIYTVGCANPGQADDTPQVDARLAAGMVFDTSYGIVDGSTTVNLSVQNTIVAANSTVLVETMKVLGISGDPLIQPGFTTTATYVLNPTDGSFPVTYNPPPPNDPLPTNNCDINLPSTTPTVSKFLGTFTTATGNSFTAQELVETTSGDITCNGQDMGTGSIAVTEIVSNSVPAEGTSSFCGGVPVFLSLVETTAGGTVITGISVERTALPVVGNIPQTSSGAVSMGKADIKKAFRPVSLPYGLRRNLKSFNFGLFR